MTSTLVIWNPKAGKAATSARLRERLESRPDTVIVETKPGEATAPIARQAAEEGYELVVAAGGDGTVNAVVNGLAEAGGSAAMGVLPLGTANDFAYSLAIPDDIDLAIDLLNEGRRVPIDVVEFQSKSEHRFFANVAAGGNSGRVSDVLTDELKRMWGPFCYLRGALEVLTDLGSYYAKIWIDEEEPFEASLWNVLIANGKTNAGRLPVAPKALLDDGLIDVILIRDGTLVDLASLVAQFALNGYLDSDQVIFRRAKSLRIESEPSMRFTVDGEPTADPPEVFRVREGAIRMVVGEAFRTAPEIAAAEADDGNEEPPAIVSLF